MPHPLEETTNTPFGSEPVGHWHVNDGNGGKLPPDNLIERFGRYLAGLIRGFAPIAHITGNPHYYAGAVVARVSTYMATLLWGLYAFVDALDGVIEAANVPPYPVMVSIAPIWAWALLAVAASAVQLVRLFLYSPPNWYGTVLNGAHCFFWAFVSLSRISYAGPGTACIVVVAALSLCAFVSSPREAASADK